MTINERDFESNPQTMEDLSLEELRCAYRSLVIEYSKQSASIRLLKTENRELRNAVNEKGITESSFERIRQEALSKYLESLPRLPRRRGKPTNSDENARAVEMWISYSKTNEPKPPFKSWVRDQVTLSYKTVSGVSLTARKKEIERHVSRIVTRISRLKHSVT